MGNSTWLDEEVAIDWTLSYETGLQEIEAFYDNEQQHDYPPFSAETTGEDEFSTLMEDIEQLTKAGSHDANYTTSYNKLHPLAVPGEPKDGRLSDSQQSEVAQEVVNTQLLSSIDAGHEEFGPLPLRSPVNIPSLNPQQHSTILSAVSHFPQELTSTSLPERSEPLQFASLPDLTEAQHPMLDHLPIPAVRMTPPKGDDELPPSSEGKSSMIEEMRSEEKRYPGRLETAKVDESQAESHIQLRGITIDDAENSELPNIDAQKPTDVNSRKSSANLGTRLRSAAIPQRKTVSLEDKSRQGTKERSVVEGPATRGRPMTKAKKQDADGEMFLDVPMKGAATELSLPNKGKKGKRNANEDATETDGNDVPNDMVKKPKPAVHQVENHQLAPKAGSEGVAHHQPPRNALGQNEMRRLTESAFLADRTPQRAISANRQTRAQKEEEAKKAPNAGRAAKERHKEKGPVQ